MGNRWAKSGDRRAGWVEEARILISRFSREQAKDVALPMNETIVSFLPIPMKRKFHTGERLNSRFPAQFLFSPIAPLWSLRFQSDSIFSISSGVADDPATSRIET